jgi:hypothetical protein
MRDEFFETDRLKRNVPLREGTQEHRQECLRHLHR